MPFDRHMKSGLIFTWSHANIFPVLPKPVATSSAIRWTLYFVENNFPNTFKKSEKAKSIPRVRFEAIAVGTILALREKSDLSTSNVDWLNSNEFKKWTTSDAANNKSKVIGRIEFVRDCLLEKIELNTLTYDN